MICMLGMLYMCYSVILLLLACGGIKKTRHDIITSLLKSECVRERELECERRDETRRGKLTVYSMHA